MKIYKHLELHRPHRQQQQQQNQRTCADRQQINRQHKRKQNRESVDRGNNQQIFLMRAKENGFNKNNNCDQIAPGNQNSNTPRPLQIKMFGKYRRKEAARDD